MSQPPKAAAAEQQLAAAQPEGAAGNRGPQGPASSAAAGASKGSQTAAMKPKASVGGAAANGAGAGDKPSGGMSWAARLGANGTAAPAAPEKQQAAPSAPRAAPAPAPGVKLPAGVAPGPAASNAIKFGSIDTADLQEGAPAAAPKAPAPPPAAPMVAVPAPPAPSGPKPASFAAAASGGAGAGGKQASISAAPQGGAQQRGPYGGGPGPRAGGGRGPQQQVPAAMPQGMPYPGQAGLVYMQPGFPAQQQYAMAYLPGGGSYFAGANYQQPQYSGYPIGAPGAAMQPPMHAGPQQPRGPPASMPAGAGPPSGPRPMAFGGGGPPAAAAAKPALPAAPRQRKVLRIENPDTHEVLDLSGMPGNQPKPAEDNTAAPASATTTADEGAAPAAPEPDVLIAEQAEKPSAADDAQVSSAAWGASKSFKEVIMVDPKIEEARKKADDDRKAAEEAKEEEDRQQAAAAAAAEAAACAAEAAAEEEKRAQAAAAKQKEDALLRRREEEATLRSKIAAAKASAAAASAAAAAATAAAAEEREATRRAAAPSEQPATASRSASAEPVDSESAHIDAFGSGDAQAPDDTGYRDDVSGRKRYNNIFLKAQRGLCTQIPEGIEESTWSALSFDGENGGGGRGPHMAGARGDDRADERWKSGRQPPGPAAGGPGGPAGGRGGRHAPGRIRGPGPVGTIDADTWERGKALPPMPATNNMPGMGYGGRGPPPGMRMPSGPLPALHKTDSAYKMGGTRTDDPDEENAQKALKSMLNKITPQNFEKITAQIVEKINERKKAITLSGFIDQIFDKALAETTFAELYADLVAKLNPALPELLDDDGNPVQFRRTLLNKCQDEFDHGVMAMKAVLDREQREKEEGPKEEAPEEVAAPEEGEEGEITEEKQRQRDAEAEAKRRDREAAKAEVAARKRMLGNMIFVGQLYRFGVLTETVMHSCIKQLLEETEHPRAEDVECMCKLLTTVGRPMDASTRSTKQADDKGNVRPVTTADMMIIYFKRIESLSNNDALDTRHRFMLRDLIELRRNNWVLRRKTEGPKKIEDIHRDAAMERNRAQAMERQQPRGGGRDMPRGPPSRPAYDNRVDAPIRIMSNVGSQSSGAQGQSFRPGGRPAPPPARPAPPPPERKVDAAQEAATDVADSAPPKATPSVKGLLAELYSAGDVDEAVSCTRELADSGEEMAAVVESLLTVSLESKGTSWELLSQLLTSASESGVIPAKDLEEGVRQLLNKLDDLTVDVPKAPTEVGDVLGALVAAKTADLKTIVQHVQEADTEAPPEGEDTMLVGSGGAVKVVASLLRSLKSKGGSEEAAAAWKATGLELSSFLPGADRADAAKVDAVAAEFEIADVVA